MSREQFREQMGYVGYLLRTNKGFREWTMAKCLQVRAKSENQKEIYFCNTILNYIYDLNWQDISRENKKYAEKGAF